MANLIKMQRLGQHYVEKTIPWLKVRWAGFASALALYILRIYVRQGFFVVTYGLGIYLLNLLIGFLSPAIDPETENAALPTSDREEFRPFTRKLPEFKFWVAATRAVLASLFMTLFQMFDLPVFWPILLVYFLLLVFMTMKDRVKHMMKHKYIPFSVGKQTYGELTKVKPGGGKKSDK